MQKPNRQTGFTVVEVFFVVISIGLLIWLGSYLWHRSHHASPTPNKTAAAAALVTSWKTYQDDHYHFSIAYPGGWSVVTSDDKSETPLASNSSDFLHTVFFSSSTNFTASSRVQYMLYVSNASVSDLVNFSKNNLSSNGPGVSFQTSTIKVNGRTGSQLVASQNSRTIATEVYLPADGLVFNFDAEKPFSDGLITSQIPAKMLGSLKITGS